jgi:hypothetical protein
LILILLNLRSTYSEYKLQLDVFLNGIGTWKNRNIIACLTVCSGEYDTLLPWPCTLKADIVLKDQPNDIREVIFYFPIN